MEYMVENSPCLGESKNLARAVQTGICLKHFYYKILKLNIKHI